MQEEVVSSKTDGTTGREWEQREKGSGKVREEGSEERNGSEGVGWLVGGWLVCDYKLTDQELPVVAPARGEDAALHLVLGHARLLLAPEAEVGGGAARKLVRRRVVAHGLDRVVVLVFHHALALDRPDDHRAVGRAARKALPVALERHAVDRVLVLLVRPSVRPSVHTRRRHSIATSSDSFV